MEYLNPRSIALIDQTDRTLTLHLNSGRVLTITNANAYIERFKEALLTAAAEGWAFVQVPEMVSWRTESASEHKDFYPEAGEVKRQGGDFAGNG